MRSAILDPALGYIVVDFARVYSVAKYTRIIERGSRAEESEKASYIYCTSQEGEDSSVVFVGCAAASSGGSGTTANAT
jgi:hypothetical protein